MKAGAFGALAALLLTSCGEAVPANTALITSQAATASVTAAATVTEAVTSSSVQTSASITETSETVTSEEPPPEEVQGDIDLETVLYDQLAGRNKAKVGCGPACAAMILHSELGVEADKDDVVELAYQKGLYLDAGYNFTYGFGMSLSQIGMLFSEYGFNAVTDTLDGCSDEEILTKIDELLSEGHRVVFGHLKDGRVLHYAVIHGRRGAEGEAVYLINDPWEGQAYELTCPEVISRYRGAEGAQFSLHGGKVKGLLWVIGVMDKE